MQSQRDQNKTMKTEEKEVYTCMFDQRKPE